MKTGFLGFSKLPPKNARASRPAEHST